MGGGFLKGNWLFCQGGCSALYNFNAFKDYPPLSRTRYAFIAGIRQLLSKVSQSSKKRDSKARSQLTPPQNPPTSSLSYPPTSHSSASLSSHPRLSGMK